MTKLKHKIRNWLFPDYRLEVDLALRTHQNATEELNKQKDRLSNYTVVDAVREQLKGFNPKLLDNSMYDLVDNSPTLLDQYEDEESENIFLSHVRDLYNNSTFRPILDCLVRNQLIYTAKEAHNFEASQFGRATINGLILFKDEVERLKAIYDERHPPVEKFDAHEIM